MQVSLLMKQSFDEIWWIWGSHEGYWGWIPPVLSWFINLVNNSIIVIFFMKNARSSPSHKSSPTRKHLLKLWKKLRWTPVDDLVHDPHDPEFLPVVDEELHQQHQLGNHSARDYRGNFHGGSRAARWCCIVAANKSRPGPRQPFCWGKCRAPSFWGIPMEWGPQRRLGAWGKLEWAEINRNCRIPT